MAQAKQLIAAIGLSLGAATQASAALMGVDFGGNLYSISETTGAATAVGASGFARLNSLALNNAGVLYTATDNANNAPGDDRLLTLNQSNGAGTAVATLNFGAVDPDVRSMAFRASDGALFAVNAGGGGSTFQNSLFRIDVSTGAGTLVAALGNFGIQGLDFSPISGVLYGWSGSLGLVSIDEGTGAVFDINGAVNGVLLQSIAFDASGTLYGASEQALYSINLASGEQTLIGNFGTTSTLRGLESIGGATPAPTPSTLALAALAAGLVAVGRRRQRASGARAAGVV